jgi:hypothetical protein
MPLSTAHIHQEAFLGRLPVFFLIRQCHIAFYNEFGTIYEYYPRPPHKHCWVKLLAIFGLAIPT